ncbi:MAG: helix-turn-helix transcriptional regulator [Atopobiaceae bacterium]|nr:helix-turn-helix transcriptional regulator [Atopobiaceae bacterium]
MTRQNDSTTARPQARRKTALSDLREGAGYRNAKEFAAVLGVPASTYSRWERGAQGPASAIPMAAAWAIADKLGCTIDAVVGRDSEPEAEGKDLNAFYRSLSEGGQRILDEFAQYLDFRERILATEGR